MNINKAVLDILFEEEAKVKAQIQQEEDTEKKEGLEQTVTFIQDVITVFLIGTPKEKENALKDFTSIPVIQKCYDIYMGELA